MNPAKIRNFSIIAHIDHGKSTLADRLLELTNLKGSQRSLQRVLDSLSLEQEKGITIKLNAVQLYYPPEETEPYVFNLIDTPGHVDFMYEVSRSLAACEGVILLVDATQGIQAQTLAYYEIAKSLNLKILPVINKIDSPLAQLETTKNQLIELLECSENNICLISAKTGQNIDLLCQKIIAEIPAPLQK
ncbi:MAG: GTP-binding protein [Candidatus Moeniiplasma glomeromycotorum]|nr:GTP-binding protein [Candidatus Moeniiplasma glomeromycotorum]MCE8167946.1 GTP-binding protein [Candidatus Moeniiplasma glomeromycotorum]MCE8169731.1 GTP-binding protein [Candidatus Moeniiplasma glomeromycotorum]